MPSFVQSLLDEFASGFDEEEEATFRNVNRDGVGPRRKVKVGGWVSSSGKSKRGGRLLID